MTLSTRLTVAMVLLVIVTATAVGVLSYRNIQAVAVPRALERINTHTRLLGAELDTAVHNARADVAGFRSAVAIDGIVRATLGGGADPRDGTTATQWKDRFAARLAAELMAKPNYSQFRVIGIADGGREILRVDRSGPDGTIRVVPEAELQTKGDRDYFKRAFEVGRNDVYVSPVELNEEQGKIETPYVPTVHAAAAIYAPDRMPFGAVVINIDLRTQFDKIRGSARRSLIYIVNGRGDYLVHPDRSREFAFEFGKSARIGDEFPELADLTTDNDNEPGIVTDFRGRRYGAALASVNLAGGPIVTVVETIPYALLADTPPAVRNSALLAGSGAVLMAIAFAILLARSLTRPLAHLTTAVERFGRDGEIRIPDDARGEIGVLARAFARMANEVRAQTAAVRHNAEILDKTFASMADAVLVISKDGNTLLANPAAERLLRGQTGLGLDAWRAGFRRFHGDSITPMKIEDTPISRAMRGESVDAQDIVVVANGETKPQHLVASSRPIRDAAGAIMGVVALYRDVTDERETELLLRQAQKMDAVGQLTGGIAHDFNNILTVITGTIEILAEAVADKPQLAAVAKMIDDAAVRGAELTSQLLAFARRQPLQPRTTDVNGLIADMVKLLRPTLGERIEIEAMLAPDAWPALVDTAQLNTALLNLAINARDAMPNGGKLTIETRNIMLDDSYASAHSEVAPGPYTMIAISDSGLGIPAAIMDKVFEPFFTTKDIGKGTGLGLSMVYGLVKQSGGHIKIYSEEGHGTTVKIYLPRAGGEQSESDPVRVPAAMPEGGNEIVLVVEDDRLVRENVVAQLRSLGYTAHAAANAGEALKVIERGEHIDLLFTDIVMPGPINGRQLATEAVKRRPALKVLFTSGYTENAIVHHGRLDPGVLLLAKPYRKSDLAVMVRTAIDAPSLD